MRLRDGLEFATVYPLAMLGRNGVGAVRHQHVGDFMLFGVNRVVQNLRARSWIRSGIQ